METKEITQWQEETAHNRFRIITPLIDPDLAPAERAELRRRIAEENSISERTLFRFELNYRNQGFNGLKPMNRQKRRRQGMPDNFDELVEAAVQLKKEVPSRSVDRIILILEMEGLVAPGVLKRSTLQRYLYRAGLGVKQMKRYTEQRNATARRYCKPHRMMLVEGDIKDGPSLPIGENGKPVETHLSALIDQHSRYILFSRWYDTESGEIVEDTLHQAILRHGKMDRLLFDNGAQYINKHLLRAADRLGITVVHAKAYHAWTKGGIERFNGFVDTFLAEAKAHGIRTLEELNHAWNAWLESYYHNKPHEGLREYYESLGVTVPAEGITPRQEWNRDSRALTFLDTSVVSDAFLHHETRTVDKAGCFSLKGVKYEASTALCGCEVEVGYDPNDLTTVTVRYKNMTPITAARFVIRDHCSAAPVKPASLAETAPESSRFLTLLEQKQREDAEHLANAISFSAYRKDGE